VDEGTRAPATSSVLTMPITRIPHTRINPADENLARIFGRSLHDPQHECNLDTRMSRLHLHPDGATTRKSVARDHSRTRARTLSRTAVSSELECAPQRTVITTYTIRAHVFCACGTRGCGCGCSFALNAAQGSVVSVLPLLGGVRARRLGRAELIGPWPMPTVANLRD